MKFRHLFLAASLAVLLYRSAQAQPAAAPTAAAPTVADKSDIVTKSVVKVYATARYPDLIKPWNKGSPTPLVGTGVVIDGKRILSNAHLLLYASQVQVEVNDSGDKINATVEAISPEIDLALLKLEDESFFERHPALTRAASLPQIKDAVTAYGYPSGGSSLSITKGIVSRIEFAKYNYGTFGLRLQVDAALNPGNSGGPAVVDDKMVGLAFSHLTKSENISYIIPNEEISLFLKAVADGGVYHGRPNLYVKLLALQNQGLRNFLKADRSIQGAVVEEVPKYPANNPLQKWDVITHIGEVPLDDEGMVRLDSGIRVGFNYLIGQTEKNGRIPLTVFRAGRFVQLDAPVLSNPAVVLPNLKGAYPSYFVYGPLVFCDATQDLLAEMIGGRSGLLWMGQLLDQGNPLLRRCDDFPNFEGERLVVVTSFFPHKISRGYLDPSGEIVKSINGFPVKNLADLVRMLRDGEGPFVEFGFDGRFIDTLVFLRSETVAATEEILNDNSVRSQGSSDMMAIWSPDKK